MILALCLVQSVAATLCPPTAILKPKCVFWLYFRQILTGIFSSLFVCARLCKGMVCAGRSKSCKNKNQDAIGFMKVCARSAHIGPVSVEMKVMFHCQVGKFWKIRKKIAPR